MVCNQVGLELIFCTLNYIVFGIVCITNWLTCCQHRSWDHLTSTSIFLHPVPSMLLFRSLKFLIPNIAAFIVHPLTFGSSHWSHSKWLTLQGALPFPILTMCSAHLSLCVYNYYIYNYTITVLFVLFVFCRS